MADSEQTAADSRDQKGGSYILTGLTFLVSLGFMMIWLHYMLFKVPRYMKIFAGFGVALPVPTKLVLSGSQAFTNLGIVLIPVVFALVVFGAAVVYMVSCRKQATPVTIILLVMVCGGWTLLYWGTQQAIDLPIYRMQTALSSTSSNQPATDQILAPEEFLHRYETDPQSLWGTPDAEEVDSIETKSNGDVSDKPVE